MQETFGSGLLSLLIRWHLGLTAESAKCLKNQEPTALSCLSSLIFKCTPSPKLSNYPRGGDCRVSLSCCQGARRGSVKNSWRISSDIAFLCDRSVKFPFAFALNSLGWIKRAAILNCRRFSFISEKCNAVAGTFGTCLWYSVATAVPNFKWENVGWGPNFCTQWTNVFGISFSEIVAQHLWGATLRSQMLLMSALDTLPNTGGRFY